jgi:hypothetical protein
MNNKEPKTRQLPDLDRMAEKILASGLDPLNSLLFSIAMEAKREAGECTHE